MKSKGSKYDYDLSDDDFDDYSDYDEDFVDENIGNELKSAVPNHFDHVEEEENPFALVLGVSSKEPEVKHLIAQPARHTFDEPYIDQSDKLTSKEYFNSKQNMSQAAPTIIASSTPTSKEKFTRTAQDFYSFSQSPDLDSFSEKFSFFNFLSDFNSKANIQQVNEEYPKKVPSKVIQSKEQKSISKSAVTVKPFTVAKSTPISAKKAIPNTFAVLGHIDAGKSTLIGHLLYKTGGLDEKTLQKYRKEAKESKKTSFEFAWALDENLEERSRGVTKDINFTRISPTNLSSFYIIDCPGHKDFVPNAIHGIIQANAGLLVVDVTNGEFETGLEHQTLEHLLLLKGYDLTNHLVIALNKADKINWNKERLQEVEAFMIQKLELLSFTNYKFIPVSALSGMNLTERLSEDYISLLEALSEPVQVERPCPLLKELRVLIVDLTTTSNGVQAIQIIVCSGELKKKEKISFLPCNVSTAIKSMLSLETEKPVDICTVGDKALLIPSNTELFSGCIERGFIGVASKNSCIVSSCFEAEITTFDLDIPMTIGYECILYLHGMEIQANFIKLYSTRSIFESDSLKMHPRLIKSNSIATVECQTKCKIPFELFANVNLLGMLIVRSLGKSVAYGRIMKAK